MSISYYLSPNNECPSLCRHRPGYSLGGEIECSNRCKNFYFVNKLLWVFVSPTKQLHYFFLILEQYQYVAYYYLSSPLLLLLWISFYFHRKRRKKIRVRIIETTNSSSDSEDEDVSPPPPPPGSPKLYHTSEYIAKFAVKS